MPKADESGEYVGAVAAGDRLFAWVVYGRDVFGGRKVLTGCVTAPDLDAARGWVAAGLNDLPAEARARYPDVVLGSSVHEVPLELAAEVLRANGCGIPTNHARHIATGASWKHLTHDATGGQS